MQSQDDLRQRILIAIAESCYRRPDEIRPEVSLVDLGLDSLAITSIVGEIESASRLEFHRDQVNTLFQAERVGDLIDQVLAITDRSALSEPQAARPRT